MDKSNQVVAGHSPCDRCSNVGTINVGGKLYCSQCAPDGEKRASTEESFKEAVESLVELHKPAS